jgi:hypothetical protein
MNRLLTACLALIAATAPAFAAGCNDKVEKQLKFSSPDNPDTFVVESFGDTCQGARLVIYVKTATNQWAPLIISEVSDYGSDPKNANELRVALKEVAGRIEGPMLSRLETWAEIRRAAMQPEGNPWRGTPLVHAEYERLLKAKPRYVYIPTDGVRAKLVVWDEHAYGGRPVDFVYYGD